MKSILYKGKYDLNEVYNVYYMNNKPEAKEVNEIIVKNIICEKRNLNYNIIEGLSQKVRFITEDKFIHSFTIIVKLRTKEETTVPHILGSNYFNTFHTENIDDEETRNLLKDLDCILFTSMGFLRSCYYNTYNLMINGSSDFINNLQFSSRDFKDELNLVIGKAIKLDSIQNEKVLSFNNIKENIRTIVLYDNYVEAIEDKENDWEEIIGVNYARGALSKENHFKSNLKADYVNNILIISDNDKIIPYFKEKINENYDCYKEISPFILINQYHNHQKRATNVYNRGPAMVRDNYIRIRKEPAWQSIWISKSILSFNIVNINKVERVVMPRGTMRDGTIWFSIDYNIGKRKKRTIPICSIADIFGRYNFDKLCNIILFYEEGTERLEESMNYINSFLATRDNSDREKYLKTARKEGALEEDSDPISSWFKLASQNADNELERVKEAYIKLKSDLLDEYKNMSDYIYYIDTHNKRPIPSIKWRGKIVNSKCTSFYLASKEVGRSNAVLEPSIRIEGRDRVSIIYLRRLYNEGDNSLNLDDKTIKKEW